MAAKLLQIRDAVHTWLAGVNGTGVFVQDISGPAQRVKGYRQFLKLAKYPAVMIAWGREESDRAELGRVQRELFLNLILVAKLADMNTSDDQLAQLSADVKNRLEVPDSVTTKWLGLVGVDLKAVRVQDVDPVEVSPEETENGIVVWNLSVLVRYRHDSGGA